MRVTAVLAGVVFVSVAAGAHAATITTVTFDLQGNDSAASTTANFNALPSSFSLTEGDLTATFDGKTVHRATGRNSTFVGGTFSDAKIGRYAGGAGVLNSAGDSHTVDGQYRDDFIEISFDKEVHVTEISFGFVDNKDYFRILTDTNDDNAIGIGDTYGDAVKITATTNPFEMDLTTDFFAVGAFGSKDNWKLKTVTVSYKTPPSNEPPAVPLPAAGWMLVAGLGGLGAMRARRKA